MTNKNNFQQLFEEEERYFETSGLRNEIGQKLTQRFAFLHLLGDLTELFTSRVIDVLIMLSDENIQPGQYFTPALKAELDIALDHLIERDIDLAIAKLKALLDQRSEKYETLLTLEAVHRTPPHQPSGNPGTAGPQHDGLANRLRGFVASLERDDFR